MGWLKDIAKRQGSNQRQLARDLLASKRWEGSPLQVDSLRNRLGRIDSGKEALVAWRPWLAEAIAEVLEVSVQEIHDESLRAGRAASDGARLYHLRGVSGSKPIDLLTEDLFPGIPTLVLEPHRWDRHWWFAPPGAGKEAAAAWLEARGRARVVRASSWDEVVERLPKRGEVFVVLGSHVEAEEIDHDRLPKRLALCVAAPAIVPEESIDEAGIGGWGTDGPDSRPHYGSQRRWTELWSEKRERWLDALLIWFERRLEPGGSFVRGEAVSLLNDPALEKNIRTPEDVLTFCGLLEHSRSKLLRGLDGDALLRAFLGGAEASRPDMDPALREFLGDPARGPALIRSLVRTTLLEMGTSEIPTPNEWASHIPDHLLPPRNVERARSMLQDEHVLRDHQTRGRLLELLAPSAEAFVHTLVDLRVFTPLIEGGYWWQPEWLVSIIGREEITRMAQGDARTLGQAALRGEPQLVLETLWKLFCDGDTQPLELALEAFDAEDLYSVAALEYCFRAAGLALLAGAKLETVTLERAWKAQRSLIIDHGKRVPPGPRLAARRLASMEKAWLGDGVFYLAALAITAQLELEGEPFSVLAPWGGRYHRQAIFFMLHLGFEDIWRTSERPPWWQGAIALGAQLLDRCPGLADDRETIATAELLHLNDIVRAAERGESPIYDIEQLAGNPPKWPALRCAAEQHGVAMPVVWRALWSKWAEGTRPPLYGPHLGHDLSEETLTEIWANAPAELFAGRLFQATLYWRGCPRRAMSEEQWRAFLSAIEKEHLTHLDQPVEDMPAPIALQLFSSGMLAQGASLQTAMALWERAPDLILEHILGVLEADEYEVEQRYLWLTPQAHRGALMDAAVAWASRPHRSERERRDVLQWLHSHVQDRRSDLERAYPLLHRLAELTRGGG
jgi:hypothetical protein